MSRTTPELDPRHETGTVERTAPPSETKQRPAARIAFVRFALAEIEPLPEDVPLTG